MTDQTKRNGKQPDFIAFNVKESQDGKGHWARVGAAWKHKDGKGYDIALDSVPVSGRVSLREMREQREQDNSSKSRGSKERNMRREHDHEQER